MVIGQVYTLWLSTSTSNTGTVSKAQLPTMMLAFVAFV